MSFTYRGTTSDSMFFNVTERQVYNAPAFDVNAIEVPGRSGDVLNSQQRFKNKTLVYTGFIRSSDFPGNTQWERLSRGLRNIKAWICGDAGKYHDLTDDYDPGFIRRAFVSGETAINILFDRPDGATITITFMAEPFMYEVSEPMELPETKSASGDIITITDGVDNTPLKSAVVNIEPVQDLHGYDYPWPAGGGKNLLGYSRPAGYSTVIAGVTWTINADGTVTANGTASGTSRFYAFDVSKFQNDAYVGQTLTVSGCPDVSGCGFHNYYNDSSKMWNTNNDQYGLTKTFTVVSGAWSDPYCAVSPGATVNNVVFKPQLELGSSATSFASYSNICPISGWSEVKVWVKPTYDTTLTPTATIPLGRTVYGGTLDVTNGVLTVDRAMVDMGTLTYFVWNKTSSRDCYLLRIQDIRPRRDAGDNLPAISSIFVSTNYNATWKPWQMSYTNQSKQVVFMTPHDEYADADAFKAAMSGVQLVYELATPIEVDLTPQTIKTLLGVNNIWANTGETEVEYIVPTENPTQWPSQPRLEITMSGAGTLTVNGKTWSIGSYTGTLICDSEIMDWYDAGALKNSLVSGDGFPELVPGDNVITYTGGITKVVATPRWRTL